MEETNLEPPNPNSTLSPPTHHLLDDNDDDDDQFLDEIEGEFSNCSTPYVSAPSSPGRSYSSYHFLPPTNGGFFYSAPTSPMHYVLSHNTPSPPSRTSSSRALLAPAISDASSTSSFEFEFSCRFDSPTPDTCPSADELFLNGQIRPMTIKQIVEVSDSDVHSVGKERSREWCRSRSQRSRRTRSLSPLRSTPPFDWVTSDDRPVISQESDDVVKTIGTSVGNNNNTPPGSGSSSRCSSAGRSSKRWVFLKDFLRSKSEGRSNNKFWHNISFSPVKEKSKEKGKEKEKEVVSGKEGVKKGTSSSSATAARAAGKRRSAHEMHYAANRAQAEEMRKKTFLPYRQGLLGCLGFNSKSYGAINGFARALNPVSSR